MNEKNVIEIIDAVATLIKVVVHAVSNKNE